MTAQTITIQISPTDELDRAEAAAGIQRGLEALEDGRTRPVKEFLAELRQEFGFPETRPEIEA